MSKWIKLGEESYPKLLDRVDVKLNGGAEFYNCEYDEDDDGGFFICAQSCFNAQDVEYIRYITE